MKTMNFLKYGGDGLKRTLVIGKDFAFGSCLAKDVKNKIIITKIIPTAAEVLEDCDK